MCKKGFTLIELSIVVVIIGLIVAGVVGGQKLVHQAKLRSVISEVDQINNAIRAFQLEYNALPGDLDKGYDFFGSSCGSDAGATSSSACNGNDNGFIEASNASYQYETRLAWRHLSSAGLFKENYPQSYDATSFVKAYKPSALGQSSYSINSIGFPGGWSHLSAGMFSFSNVTSAHKGLFIGLGAAGWHASLMYDNLKAAGDITPKDAYSIDKKVDDGVAQTGWVLTRRGYSQSAGKCGPSRTGTTAAGESEDYVLTDTTASCRMSFKVK